MIKNRIKSLKGGKPCGKIFIKGMIGLQIAVCDDKRADLEYIHRVIADAMKLHNISGEFALYTDAKQMLQRHFEAPFDVIFLDLDMPEIDGLEVAEQINKLDEATEIVLVTNHDELVYQAYRLRALGFIRKKYLEDEADKIIDSIIESINSRRKYMIIQDAGVEYKYNVNDVVFMQSDDHYVDIFSQGKKDTVRNNLNSIEKQYAHYGFIRIHSRYLVNYRYIFSIEKNVIVLNNQQQFPLSRSRYDAVKKAFQFFCRRI